MAKVVSTAPERIWLDLGFDPEVEDEVSFNDLFDATWSHDNATGNGIEYVRADLTRPQAREPLTQWQPSDTAPQDGTKCLVYWGRAYGQPLIGVAARLVPYQGEMLWHGHGGSHNEVTHWMPLPPPPTEAAQNIGQKK